MQDEPAPSLDVTLALKRLRQVAARVDDEGALAHVPALLEACLTSRDGVAFRPLGSDERATSFGLAVHVRVHPTVDYLALGIARRPAHDDPSRVWRELRPWVDAQMGIRSRELLGRLWAWAVDEQPDRLAVTTAVARELRLLLRREGHDEPAAIA